MNNRFAEHVTSTAFNLSLSKRMIDAMCGLDKYKYIFSSDSTVRSLEARGLIVRTGKKDPEGREPQHISGGYKLSDAGEAVIPLIKLAGLFPTYYEFEEPVYAHLEEPKVTLKQEFVRE